MTPKHVVTQEDREAARKLRELYGTVIMEAPEYVPSIEEGAEIIVSVSGPLREALRLYRQIHDDRRDFPKKPDGTCDCAQCERTRKLLEPQP